MNRLFYAFLLLLSSVMYGAWADDGFYLEMADGSNYDADYAQDFARCSQNFVAGVSPVLANDLKQDNYHLCFHGFAVLYSGVSRTALYSAEHLTKSRITTATTMAREDNFRSELRLPSDIRAELDDYKGTSQLDRGHLAPNGDMADRVSQYDSFSLANIIPQDSRHNRELWRDIESQVRQLAIEYGDVYVVTGTVFVAPQVQHAGKILIPSHLYKAVYIPSTHQSVVYYTKNSTDFGVEMIDLAALQARTGVTAFPSVSNASPLQIDLPNQPKGVAQVSWREFFGQLMTKVWQMLG